MSKRFKRKLYVGRLPLVALVASVFACWIAGAVWLAQRGDHDSASVIMLTLVGMLLCGLLWALFTQLVRLNQIRENMRLTIASSTDVGVLLDSKTRYLEIFSNSDANGAANRETDVGKFVRDVMGEEIGREVQAIVTQVLETGKKRSFAHERVVDGKTLWFEAVFSKRDAGTVVVMSRDMTSQRALSQQLEDQRLFMEKILNTIPDPVFLKDENHRWLYANDAFCAILGKTREEFYGKRDADFFPPEISATFYESDRQTFSSMVEIEREEQLPQEVSSSGMLIGGERTILTKKSPLIARDGTKTLVGIIRDITERKLLQKQLEEQRARQIAASRMASLGEMAGGVAHEINNPLAIISGYAGRLSDVLNQNPIPRDKALDIVSRIDTTTIRIATIIKGLRAISRDGEFDEKEVVSLSVIVADTMSLCAERFISKGVYVETKVDPGLVVFCRSVQISQVLLNLLTNAFFSVSKSPGGNILIEAKLRGDWVEIAVTDSGEGVPAHHREKIFEPFFTTKPIGSGTGLGLSIGVSIVRDHGGELILDSNAEKTRFVFRLPVGPPKDNP